MPFAHVLSRLSVWIPSIAGRHFVSAFATGAATCPEGFLCVRGRVDARCVVGLLCGNRVQSGISLYMLMYYLQVMKRAMFESRAARELYGLEDSISSPPKAAQHDKAVKAPHSITRPRLNAMAQKIKQGRRTMCSLDQSVAHVNSEVLCLPSVRLAILLSSSLDHRSELFPAHLLLFLGAKIRTGFQKCGSSYRRTRATVRLDVSCFPRIHSTGVPSCAVIHSFNARCFTTADSTSRSFVWQYPLPI